MATSPTGKDRVSGLGSRVPGTGKDQVSGITSRASSNGKSRSTEHRTPNTPPPNAGRRVPLPRRWNRRVLSNDQFLDERVEHRPLSPTCAGCAHLGEPLRITDAHGARRFRRACPCDPLGFTDPDWPVCADYQERTP
jgi:hypothetical protein